MGQIESQQIAETVATLQNEKSIHFSQSQKFLHDYHMNNQCVQQVNKFNQNKWKLFLKYFILNKYSQSVSGNQQSFKRMKTNQSTTSYKKQMQSSSGSQIVQIGLDSISGLICFQTIKLKQNMQKLCQKISLRMVQKNHPQNCNSIIKQFLDLIGIRQLQFLKESSNGIQQLTYTKNKNHFQLVQKTQSNLSNNRLKKIKKNKFTKVSKSQLVKQRLVEGIKNPKSQSYFLVQNVINGQNSFLVVSFFDQFLMAQHSVENNIAKYINELRDLIQPIVKILFTIKKNTIQTKNYKNTEFCWLLLKVYKAFHEFDQNILVQKIKVQSKSTLNLKPFVNSLEVIRTKIQDYSQDAKNSKQACQELKKFITQYEEQAIQCKSSLAYYIQCCYQSIETKVCSFQFNENHELKIIICSDLKQTILQEIKPLLIQNNDRPLTIVQVFGKYKHFSQFYANAANLIKNQDSLKVIQNNAAQIQFIFKNTKLKSIRVNLKQQFQILQKKNSSDSNADKKNSKKIFAPLHNLQNPSQKKQKSSYLVKKGNISEKDLTKTKNLLLNKGKKLTINIHERDLNILDIQYNKLHNFAQTILLETTFLKKQQNVNLTKLNRFINRLSEEYEQHQNPFHNFVHGVNVMHTTFLFCSVPKNIQLLSQFSRFVLILSALCHDTGHTGFNNAFQIGTLSPLALKYNDVSPLENHHISRTLELLNDEQTNFIEFMTKGQAIKLRKLLISNILNTDIKEHFNVLKKFDQKKNSFKKDDFQDEKLISGMILHSSDFAGSNKDFAICQQWSRRVNQQFKIQSIKEKEYGLPLTPFILNLQNPLILAKNQLGFLKFMVQPLYKSIAQYLQHQELSQSMLKMVNNNIDSWDNVVKSLKVQQPIVNH